ncbi:helix-turn-helix domain-containing protein [Cupriavidus plantarum]|uniref:helix-turn-helix domain-containing protein n=2 Tax=Cupriavidus plantarum TaxID=942865 RepID=UPI00339DA68A
MSQSNAGLMFAKEEQPLQRSRSTKPSKRLQKFRSKAYRSSFAETTAANHIAFQIRHLREAAGMSQTELARKLRTRQSAVARLEDPTYGKQSLAILHRVARIFDVVTWVEFTSYSGLLRRSANVSPAAITPLPYEQEFDAEGEPMTSVNLHFDGSVICMTNYVTRPNLLIQTTPESTVLTNNLKLIY